MTDIVEVTADVAAVTDTWVVSWMELSRVEACDLLDDGDGAIGAGELDEAMCAIIPSNWVFMAVMVAA